MLIGCPHADIQGGADILRGHSLAEKRQDLLLPGRQIVLLPGSLKTALFVVDPAVEKIPVDVI